MEIRLPGGPTNIRSRGGVDIYKADYRTRIIGTAKPNLIGYWPLDETAGVNAADLSGRGHNGVYDGPTLNNAAAPDGYGSPLFDGINDSVNCYSVSLRDAWNGAEGTFLAWVKVAAVGVWTDGANRYAIYFAADGTNFVGLKKDNTNNRFEFVRQGGGVAESGRNDAMTTTDWFSVAVTWSESGDRMNYYIGTGWTDFDTGLGAWVGNLNANTARIGRPTAVSPAAWSGWIAHVALWDTPLGVNQLMNLMVI